MSVGARIGSYGFGLIGLSALQSTMPGPARVIVAAAGVGIIAFGELRWARAAVVVSATSVTVQNPWRRYEIKRSDIRRITIRDGAAPALSVNSKAVTVELNDGTLIPIAAIPVSIAAAVSTPRMVDELNALIQPPESRMTAEATSAGTGSTGRSDARLRPVRKARDARDIEALRRYLRDPGIAGLGVRVRAAAADAIGQLRAVEAADDVMALLRDPSAQVRLMAAYAVAKLGVADGAPEIARTLEVEQDRACISGLIAALRGTNNPEAVPALTRVATAAGRHRYPTTVRAQATWALGRLRHRSAIPTLRTLTHDPSPRVRKAAVVGLGGIESPEALSALREVRSWRHPLLRIRAMAAADRLDANLNPAR